MVNEKATIKNIHERLPQLTIDDIISILDSIVEYLPHKPLEYPSYTLPSAWPDLSKISNTNDYLNGNQITTVAGNIPSMKEVKYAVDRTVG